MDSIKSVKFDESTPELCEIPDGTQAVYFGNRGRRALDRAALTEALGRQTAVSSVTMLSIDRSSEMRSLWVAELFPNLRVVDIFGSRIETLTELERLAHLKALLVQTDEVSRRSLDVLPRLRLESLSVSRVNEADVEHVNSCLELRSLELGRWPLPNFEKLKIVPNEELVTSGDTLIATEGLNYAPTGLAMFTDCRELKYLIGLAATTVRIKSCPQLDLGTSADVRGLHNLWIEDQGVIRSVEFLRGCTELEELSVSATRLEPGDWSPLAESQSLRRALLGPSVTDGQIRQISAANRKLAITNAITNYKAGRKISLEELYK
jgi:hypothetical protein